MTPAVCLCGKKPRLETRPAALTDGFVLRRYTCACGRASGWHYFESYARQDWDFAAEFRLPQPSPVT